MHGGGSEIPRVVIVGGGFGGLFAAKALRRAPVGVVLVDKSNHHLFQPLLYQVAMAGLSPADIAHPIRAILSRQPHLEVSLAEVRGVDLDSQEVLLDDRKVPFDFLILATGARHSYFGHDEWSEFALGLKTLEDALRIRRQTLLAFERAEMAKSDGERSEWLTFVVVGGGPTGVELAGSIAEIGQKALTREFDHIDPSSARIVLIEAADRVLPGFDPELSERAKRSLESLHIEVQVGTKVVDVTETGVETTAGRIAARSVLWAAGVRATPVAEWLGAECDSAGRVKVLPDLTVPGHPNVFVIGDAMTLAGPDGKPLPGVCQVAMQQGAYAARVIEARARGTSQPPPFRYRDKGIMATIGRRLAVAQIGKLRLSGTVAWLVWLFIHIWYLIGFRNKLLVMIQWAWSYVTFKRGARLITDAGEPTKG